MSKSNLEDIITKKFILELNEVLAFENAGIERLQTRIEEISIPEAKQQIQHHLKESLEHQKRLQQLITSMGGEPTQLKVELPLPSYPDIIRKMMENSMTKYEWELKKTEHDLIHRKRRSFMLPYADRESTDDKRGISKGSRASIAEFKR